MRVSRHFVLAVLLASPSSVEAQRGDAAFDALVARHISARAERSPEWATSVGLHTADDRLDDRRATAFAADSARIERERRALAAIDTSRLTVARRIDWLLLRSALDAASQDAR